MQHGVIQPDGRLYVDNSILATEDRKSTRLNSSH